MNIYKAPNPSPKRKVYRRGGGAGALNDESIYTHIYTHTHTLSLSPPFLSLSHSVRKRRLLGGEEMLSLIHISEPTRPN